MKVVYKSIENIGKELESIDFDKIFIISDENIGNLYLSKLKKALKEFQVYDYLLPQGEGSKNFNQVLNIYDKLIHIGASRKTLVLTLGGGVVGDIGGFVAATYTRGLKYVQIPSSFLAMVDSSIGGKVGIDYKGIKNLIGSFYFPEFTLIDIKLLSSIGKRDLVSGLGEVFKYGLISDINFFNYTYENLGKILDKDYGLLEEVVKRSIDIKIQIVERDRLDLNLRNILNFGHTIGHGLESLYGFTRYNHGESVIIGMVYEAYIGFLLGLIQAEYFETIYKVLSNLLTLPKFKGDEIDKLFYFIEKDKKSNYNSINLVLPYDYGRVKLYKDIDKDLIYRSLRGEWIEDYRQ